MWIKLICAIAAFAAGTAIAYLNNRIVSSSAANEKNSKRFALRYFLRMAISAAFLFGLFIIGHYTDFDSTWLLAGGAFGLTIPGIVFAVILSQKIKKDK